MQPQYANALKEADVDAYVIDAFSNGSDKTVEANLFNFIETIQSAKPGVPIIFMRTIRMENRNFKGEPFVGYCEHAKFGHSKDDRGVFLDNTPACTFFEAGEKRKGSAK